MSALDIITIGDPLLRQRAAEIEPVGEEYTRLAEMMIETMKSANGVGLAAPQVGRSVRLVVYQEPEKMTEPRVMINPKIVSHSLMEEAGAEGCLSVPDAEGRQYEVPRYTSVRVEFLSLEGKKQERKARQLEARIIQHEMDHLDGVLYVDRVSDEDKAELRKKWTPENIK